MIVDGVLVDDRYRVLERVGEGITGVVYRARHETLTHRQVALRVVHPQLATDPDFLQRFEKEAQDASRVHHPHAVTIYDYGRTEEKLSCLAMESVYGPSLTERIASDPRGLPLHEVVSVARQIGSAFAAMHREDIAHGDLEPGSIPCGLVFGSDSWRDGH